MINSIVFNPDKPSILEAEQFKDSAIEFSVDANYWAVREGGALGSVAWSVLAGDASLGSNTEASNVSTAKITTGTEGESLIQVKLTLDASGSSQIGIQLIRIRVPLVAQPGIKY